MAENSLFWIASQTKPITATALMMLVDEGRVNLDDPVEKYLPEFRGPDGDGRGGRRALVLGHAARILRRSEKCLSHTSGLPFGSPIEHPTRDPLPLWATVALPTRCCRCNPSRARATFIPTRE